MYIFCIQCMIWYSIQKNTCMNILCIIDIVHVVALENAKETTHELSRVRSLELKREKKQRVKGAYLSQG